MKLPLLSIIAVCVMQSSCATMGPNDGLVPRMAAQANLPYVPVVTPTGLMAAPDRASSDRASSGMMVAPLADTRRAFWQ